MKPASVLLLLHVDQAIRARPWTISSDHGRAPDGIRAHWPIPLLFGVSTQLCGASSATTLRDVRCDRCTRTTNLARQPVQLLTGETCRCLVYLKRQLVRLVPHLQLSKIARRHVVSSQLKKEAGFPIGDYYPGTRQSGWPSAFSGQHLTHKLARACILTLKAEH